MLALRWVNARLEQSLKGYVRCSRGGKLVFFASVCIIPVSGATSTTPTLAVTQNSAPMDRVAKCHRYGGYIRVRKLEGWGKKSGRINSVAISSIVLGKFDQLI